MAENKWVTRVITLAYLKGVMTLFTVPLTGLGTQQLGSFFSRLFTIFVFSLRTNVFWLTTTLTHWCCWGGCSSGCKGTSRSLLVFIFFGAFASSKGRWKAWKHHPARTKKGCYSKLALPYEIANLGPACSTNSRFSSWLHIIEFHFTAWFMVSKIDKYHPYAAEAKKPLLHWAFAMTANKWNHPWIHQKSNRTLPMDP